MYLMSCYRNLIRCVTTIYQANLITQYLLCYYEKGALTRAEHPFGINICLRIDRHSEIS